MVIFDIFDVALFIIRLVCFSSLTALTNVKITDGQSYQSQLTILFTDTGHEYQNSASVFNDERVYLFTIEL